MTEHVTLCCNSVVGPTLSLLLLGGGLAHILPMSNVFVPTVLVFLVMSNMLSLTARTLLHFELTTLLFLSAPAGGMNSLFSPRRLHPTCTQLSLYSLP